MGLEIKQDSWLYVLIRHLDSSDQIVGQKDDEFDVAYIPAFQNKENALMGMGRIARQKGSKYEVQAIIFEDLIRHAAAEKFCVFILDEDGKILEKYSPEGNLI